MKTDRIGKRARRRASLRFAPGDNPYQLAFLPPPAERLRPRPKHERRAAAGFGVLALALAMVFGTVGAGSDRAGRTPTAAQRPLYGVLPAVATFANGIPPRGSASMPSVSGPELVYVPESMAKTVAVIDARTYRVVRRLAVGREPQHVTTSDRWLFAGAAVDDSLTLVDARSGRSQRRLDVVDPYNLYRSPDGTKVIVVAERRDELRLLHPRRLTLMGVVRLPGRGASHLAFTRDGRTLVVTAVDSGDLVKVDVEQRRVVGVVHLGGMPVDVKLSPDGRIFLVANQALGGVSIVDARSLRATGFIRTGAGAHGLALSRDGRRLYVANRAAGTIGVIDLAGRRLVATWTVGGSPDGLQLSTDGRELWTSNRFHASVSVVEARSGRVRHTIRVNGGPHGLAYFPSPSRGAPLSE